MLCFVHNARCTPLASSLRQADADLTAFRLCIGHLHGSGINDTESSNLKTAVRSHVKIYPGLFLV